ncbi:MAG: hypothetical protein FWE91_11300 [Defluviitaleaceae bacterium]|nr:hypothetical protein [Defluviitaleaceae bacterium]MCL2837129.1 hypothetical protein [Defluviitaleaceae bacterium]
MIERLKEIAAANGDRLAAMKVEHLAVLKRNFEKLGIPAEEYFNYEPPADLDFTVKSVLVAACRSPLSSATFTYGGEKRTVLIPPGYLSVHSRERIVRDYLSGALNENGFNIKSVWKLPAKQIAALTGLGAYGRNNIIYVDGMGSFINLHLYFTDLECEGEPFDGEAYLTRMPSCSGCDVCVRNCPTASLNFGAEMIDINRCICWLNEHPGAFPDWLDPALHNALFGCMFCQDICPHNKDFINNAVNVADFNEEQTNAFLNGTAGDELFAAMGIVFFKEYIPRNLKVLLN